jgi:hypothetical protein
MKLQTNAADAKDWIGLSRGWKWMLRCQKSDSALISNRNDPTAAEAKNWVPKFVFDLRLQVPVPVIVVRSLRVACLKVQSLPSATHLQKAQYLASLSLVHVHTMLAIIIAPNLAKIPPQPAFFSSSKANLEEMKK